MAALTSLVQYLHSCHPEPLLVQGQQGVPTVYLSMVELTSLVDYLCSCYPEPLLAQGQQGIPTVY
jgi:hypothetical protein